ncbi:MAG: hypothetical protein QOJ29_1010 [Thermoleophilaceae bacterium]|nr:hypothetical protein [Thermoleophilaceae bacterium]
MLQKRLITHALTVTATVSVLFVLAALIPSIASAGVYTVPFCDRSSSGSTNSWTHTSTASSTPYFWADNTCRSGSGYVYRRFQVWTVPAGASDDWTFDAPAGTYISQLDMYQDAIARSAGALTATYYWQQDGGNGTVAAAAGGGSLASRSYYFPVSGSKVVKLRNSLMCQTSSNCPGTDPAGNYGNEEYWHGAVVHLVDPSLPVLSSVSGPGWNAEPSDGQNTIDYTATDSGSGVREARFYVDGALQSTRSGSCASEVAAPCPDALSGRFTVDTTRLSEGSHDLKIVLTDGSWNEDSKQLEITVRRPPKPADPGSGGGPVGVGNTTWSGTDVPAAGDQLHGSQGSWSGTGLTYTYQWMRCDANGTACAPIQGANGLNYTATNADVGHALQFCVTATNSGGTATSCSTPTPAVVAAHPQPAATPPSSTPTSGNAETADRPGEPVKASTGQPAAAPGGGSGERGQPNGSPAADKVVLTALVNNRSSTMKVKFGKRVPISGKLVGADGAPIANAILNVQTRTAVAGASIAEATGVVTGKDGRFTYLAPAGPSRLIRFAYRSYSADTTFADTSDVNLLVSAAVTIKATPKRVRNRHATVFTGRLLGKPIGKRGVVVDLQVFFRGKWRTFGAPRTTRAGKYRFKYRFMAGAATWKFRARVRAESSYPYTSAYSGKTVRVKVLN